MLQMMALDFGSGSTLVQVSPWPKDVETSRPGQIWWLVNDWLCIVAVASSPPSQIGQLSERVKSKDPSRCVRRLDDRPLHLSTLVSRNNARALRQSVSQAARCRVL